jgi:hypothetical protein
MQSKRLEASNNFAVRAEDNRTKAVERPGSGSP